MTTTEAQTDLPVHKAEPTQEYVQRAHGGGGELMEQLIRDHILPALGNDLLSPLTDGAVLQPITGRPVMTTDGYVVQPLEFPGGDIGKLSVCGTVNDLAMMGATPIALSLAMILEEGLPIATLDRIVASIASTAGEVGVRVVTGDTKVVESTGKEPGLFITTAGVGVQPDHVRLGADRIVPGDRILINGPIAEHGLAIMAAREGLDFETRLRSDAAPLHALVQAILECGRDDPAGPAVKFLRDATRGGLANVLADLTEQTDLNIEIDEAALPITRTARHAAELLGLDPLSVANEGKCVMVVSAHRADEVVSICRELEVARETAIIGTVQPPDDDACGVVELLTTVGGRRIVQRPYGEELPRIC